MANNALISIGMGLMIFFVVIQLLPVINGNVASSVTLPAAGSGSEWNATVNTELTTASDMYESVGGILKVTLIVSIVAVLLAYLYGITPGNKEGQ